MFLFYISLLIEVASADFKLLDEAGATALNPARSRVISSLLVVIGCVGIFHLKYYQTYQLQQATELDLGANARTFVAAMLIAGGIAEFICTFQQQEAIVDTSGSNINCKDFVRQEITYTSGVRFKNVGVNLCLLPHSYGIILWLTPLVVGIDLAFGKFFQKNVGFGPFKFLRLVAYGLIILLHSILLVSFYSGFFSFCKAYGEWLEDQNGVSKDTDKLKCTGTGYFPPSFNTEGTWGANPGWHLNAWENLQGMYSGYMILIVGSALAILVGVLSAAAVSFGKSVKFSSVGCKCDGKGKRPILSGISAILLIIGAIIVMILGFIVNYGTGVLGVTGMLFSDFVVYFYWVYVGFLCLLVACDVLSAK